jgi:hypothetical protein
VKRSHKFGVAPKTERYSKLLGRTFDSKGERRFAEHLESRRLNGEIRDLQFQVRVILKDTVLTVPMVVDFKYWDEHLDEWIWCEFKGFPTPAFRRQKKAWALLGPGTYVVVKRTKSRIEPYSFETIRPMRPVEAG